MGIDLTFKSKKSMTDLGPGGAPAAEKQKTLGDALFDGMVAAGGLLGALTKADDASWYEVGISRSQMKQITGLIGMAKGGPFTKGQPMIVGEMGPEMILPNQGGQVLNAQRTQQMMQAGIQRGMGGTVGGGGTTSINTGGNVVSAPTTNYVNNGIAARRPIILAA
jgi:hypothetical protein